MLGTRAMGRHSGKPTMRHSLNGTPTPGRAAGGWECRLSARGEKDQDQDIEILGLRAWRTGWNRTARADRRGFPARRALRGRFSGAARICVPYVFLSMLPPGRLRRIRSSESRRSSRSCGATEREGQGRNPIGLSARRRVDHSEARLGCRLRAESGRSTCRCAALREQFGKFCDGWP
jgi:hypothetical protein